MLIFVVLGNFLRLFYGELLTEVEPVGDQLLAPQKIKKIQCTTDKLFFISADTDIHR